MFKNFKVDSFLLTLSQLFYLLLFYLSFLFIFQLSY